METSIVNQGAFVLYEDVTGCETAVIDYIDQTQRDRERRQELTEKLKAIMTSNKSVIVKHIEHYNWKEDTTFNFNKTLQIAIDWDVDDMFSLLSLCEKKEFQRVG